MFIKNLGSLLHCVWFIKSFHGWLLYGVALGSVILGSRKST